VIDACTRSAQKKGSSPICGIAKRSHDRHC
jgi:hypothetical protein